MSQTLHSVLGRGEKLREGIIRRIEWNFQEIERLLNHAFAEYAAGNFAEARSALFLAQNLELRSWGVAHLTQPLFEEWFPTQ